MQKEAYVNIAKGIITIVHNKAIITQMAKNAYSAHTKQVSKNFIILLLFSD